MSYQALYRMFRPQSFMEVVGQDHVIKTLSNAVKEQKVSHAYLFSGPRGTGKTSIAKILAKTINCEHQENGEACNQCVSCQDINNHPDIIEIDAASNNGVEEIREIRDKVRYTPTKSKYKVYIIDEVHMLTVQAFNALLKTLEEPPSHAIFILATTEPHKIPLTILSRCQRYDFKRIGIKEIMDRMRFIVKEQSVEVEESALNIIARVAQGGMRDALSLLDQAISHSNGTVTLEDVTEVTGTVSLNLLGDVVSAIDQHNVTVVLKIVKDIIDNGKEPQFFIEDLITYYRDILLYSSVGDDIDLSKAVIDDAFRQLVKQINVSRIYEIVDTLSECQNQMKWTSNGQVILELFLSRVCLTPSSQSTGLDLEVISEMKQEISELRIKVEQLSQVQKFSNSHEEMSNFSLLTEPVNEAIEDSGKEEKIAPVSLKTPIVSQKDLSLEGIAFGGGFNLLNAIENDLNNQTITTSKEESVPQGADNLNLLTDMEREDAVQEEEIYGLPKHFTWSNDVEEQSPEDFMDQMEKGTQTVIQPDEVTYSYKDFSSELEESQKSSPQELNTEGGVDNLLSLQMEEQSAAPVQNEGNKEAGLFEIPSSITVIEGEPITVTEMDLFAVPDKPKSVSNTEKVNEILKGASRNHLNSFQQHLSEIKSLVKKEKLSVYTLFEQATPVLCSDNHFVLTYKKSPEAKAMERLANRRVVEVVVEEVMLRKLELVSISEDEWIRIRDEYIVKFRNQQR